MTNVRTVPAVPLHRNEFDPSLSCETVRPNPLKPRYSRPFEALTVGKDMPNPIYLCVSCRSKDLSKTLHFFWLWRRCRFVCNECGTALQQIGDRYKLVRVPNSESAVSQKYAGKVLYSREWANIANGGLSDEEIIVSWNSSARVSRPPGSWI